VFAVWEPILPADARKPADAALPLLSDPRVLHFWDPRHLLAKQMAKDARAPQPKPECCTRDGILWDLAAVYPPGARWTAALPTAVLFDGAVVRKRTQIQSTLRGLLAR